MNVLVIYEIHPTSLNFYTGKVTQEQYDILKECHGKSWNSVDDEPTTSYEDFDAILQNLTKLKNNEPFDFTGTIFSTTFLE